MRGFTLLELMIAMAITAVLASIAWPGYQGVMHRALRVDARLALLRIQAQQERHYLSHNAYAVSLTAPPSVGGLGLASISESGNYTLAIETSPDAQAFLATARATGRQTNDEHCMWLSLNETGLRRASSGVTGSGDPHRCWG
jgi:type IV pilus assembly protein PilE